jgi:DeoR/GlpR family transcriptional regulator of sugar metabolism
VLTAERHRAILRLLAERGTVTLREISGRFAISHATARRDAAILAANGRVARAHGGLLPADFFRREPHFRAKTDHQRGIKASIARKAAELVPHDGNVFIDAGTTCLEIGRLLLDRRDLHIFTNSIPLLGHAAESQGSLTALGGDARKVSLALTGALAQSWMNHLRFDFAVIGCSGLNLNHGAYTTELQEAAVKAEVLRRSGLRLLAADSDKWNRSTAVHFAPWKAFSFFVTNQLLPREARLKLAADHVKIFAI